MDSFDTNFHLLPPDNRFQDPNIESGFAPFDVKLIGDKVFVTYAKQNTDKHDDVAGPGNGFIDVFSTEGRLLKRFASGLWGFQRGTDKSGGRNSVWFAAGINAENNGLLGTLRAEK
ncbi:hypothetical protein [Streptomyces mirabilis]|uniref:hypothetical protein n=1 Tax=Streptomyces mirabilis TaxID=68239 RepID=UPI0033D6EF7F